MCTKFPLLIHEERERERERACLEWLLLFVKLFSSAVLHGCLLAVTEPRIVDGELELSSPVVALPSVKSNR